MAFGKNKKLGKGGKKGAKKKVGDPFLKKEWYDVKAPNNFKVRSCAKTVVSKTAGQKIASDGLKGRVLEMNLADLDDDEVGNKKIRLRVDEVQGKNCLTDFHGWSYTRDNLCSMIRKGQSLIEGSVDEKTTDGFTVRMFCLAFTDKPAGQVKTNCYAQTAQIRKVRKVMMSVMKEEVSKNQLQGLVKTLLTRGTIEDTIRKKASSVFPLKEIHIRKIKVLKRPRLDITKLMEIHAGGETDAGTGVRRGEDEAAQNTLSAEVAEQEETKEE